nr:MFS transporter [Micromonospora echinaurantiaca]
MAGSRARAGKAAERPVTDMREDRSRAVLTLVCVSQFMVVLGVTVVTITMPAVQAELGVRTGDLQWIISAYALAFAGALVVAGRAADLYGRRRLFLAGLVVFGVASAGCATAGSAAALLAARAVQGVGAAMLAPSALAILVAAFPAGVRRTRAVAWYTAAQAVGGASGWIAGGIVGEHLGWRWLFLANVPVCMVVLVGALWIMRAGPGRLPAPNAQRPDIAGAVLVTAGMALLVLGLTQVGGPAAHWSVSVGLGGGTALLGLFAWVERRVQSPLLPAGLLRQRTLGAGLIVSMAVTGTTTSVLLLCALYLQDVAHLSATVSGLAFVPFNLAVVAASLGGPALLRGRAAGVAMTAGMVTIAVSALLLLALPVRGEPLAVTIPAFLLMGLGNGLAAVMAVTIGTRAAGDHPGAASGLLNSASELGVASGLATLVTLASLRTAALTGSAEPTAAEALSGYRWAFVGAALAVLGAAAGALHLLRRGARGAD